MNEKSKRDPAPETAPRNGNGNGEADLAAGEIKELLKVGEIEDIAGEEAVIPDEEVQGAEHLRAAEGIMTFRTLRDVDDDAWMSKRLRSIGKKHNTGPNRPTRSGIARKVFGA